MKWLKNYRKNKFANKVLNQCDDLLCALLIDDKNEFRNYAQEETGIECFDMLIRKGQSQVNSFQNEVRNVVSSIVKSDNPVGSMRKEIIRLIHNYIYYEAFFDDKYYNKRHLLYDLMNKEITNSKRPDLTFSDELLSNLYAHQISKYFIFKFLMAKYFENIGKAKWLPTYIDGEILFQEQALDLLMAEVEERDVSVTCKLIKETGKQLEKLQRDLLGEVVIKYSTRN